MPPKQMKKLRKTAASEPARKPMPVTILSGFLGSGKTSLMKHILENKEGLRVAVIMNEITEVNLDVMALEGSKLLKQEEKLVEMANGCICCTLREDLLLQLRELARSGNYDAVLIESSGIAEPMQVAETFFVNVGDGNPELQQEAPLDNCVTVIDASMLEQHMESLSAVNTLDPTADTAEGQQDIAMLLFAQLEFANIVLLNKVDLLSQDEKERDEKASALAALVKKINHQCTVIKTEQSRVPLDKILRTGNFGLKFTQGINNWMVDIQKGIKHVPETLEYGVSGFYWTADLPFHPKRLHDWYVKYFSFREYVMEEVPEEEGKVVDAKPVVEGEVVEGTPVEGTPVDAAAEGQEKSAEDERKAEKSKAPSKEVLEGRNNARRERYGNLFRSKGFVRIAGPARLKYVAQIQQSGSILTFQPAGLARDTDTRVPLQMLTFVGQHLKEDILKADLEGLLMTMPELQQFAMDLQSGKTDTIEDPFEPFPPPAVFGGQ